MAKKILVVDDSKTSLFLEQMILRKGHYAVVTADDGEEAVSRALSEKPDLVLMDVMMPKLDGFGAVRRLRSDPATRHVPVIMVTTRGERSHVVTGFESGCTDYVTKPVDSLELLAKVRRCLHEA
jgi:DNA-binding response OmpR family regulator